LTPLVLDDGSAVGVVRGWVRSADDPAAAAPFAASFGSTLPGSGTEAGTVVVRGVLRPGEAPVDRAPGEGTGLPDGQVPAVAPADLVQLWPHPLLTGYVIATSVEPTVDPAPAAVPTLDAAETGWSLRNVSYALQWWVFAGFGLFMWWRLVRDDARGVLTAPDGPETGPAARAAAPVGDDGSSAAVPGARP
jgi:cytochrome oxidase assembly protein ShyY1